MSNAAVVVSTEVRAGLACIESVHGVPASAPPLRVELFTPLPRSSLGVHQAQRHPAEHRIFIDAADARLSRLVIIHEYGHFLDSGVLGQRTSNKVRFASEYSPELGAWWAAVKDSVRYRQIDGHLEARRKGATTPAGTPSEAQLEYLVSRRELFARSYTQFIAVRSGDAVAGQLLSELATGVYPIQWKPGDFVEIDAAFAALVRSREWT